MRLLALTSLLQLVSSIPTTLSTLPDDPKTLITSYLTPASIMNLAQVDTQHYNETLEQTTAIKTQLGIDRSKCSPKIYLSFSKSPLLLFQSSISDPSPYNMTTLLLHQASCLKSLIPKLQSNPLESLEVFLPPSPISVETLDATYILLRAFRLVLRTNPVRFKQLSVSVIGPHNTLYPLIESSLFQVLPHANTASLILNIRLHHQPTLLKFASLTSTNEFTTLNNEEFTHDTIRLFKNLTRYTSHSVLTLATVLALPSLTDLTVHAKHLPFFAAFMTNNTIPNVQTLRIHAMPAALSLMPLTRSGHRFEELVLMRQVYYGVHDFIYLLEMSRESMHSLSVVVDSFNFKDWQSVLGKFLHRNTRMTHISLTSTYFQHRQRPLSLDFLNAAPSLTHLSVIDRFTSPITRATLFAFISTHQTLTSINLSSTSEFDQDPRIHTAEEFLVIYDQLVEALARNPAVRKVTLNFQINLGITTTVPEFMQDFVFLTQQLMDNLWINSISVRKIVEELNADLPVQAWRFAYNGILILGRETA